MSNLRYAKYQDPNATAIDDPNKVVELTAAEVASTQALVSEYEIADTPSFARTYTWATLPAAADFIGTAYITDIGERGSLWRSDGSSWGIVGGSVVLYASAVAGATLTGTLTETIIYTYVMPAGLMGPNGALEIQSKHTVTNNANTKTFKVRFGGIGGTYLQNPQSTGNSSVHLSTRIENRNSQASQIGGNGGFNLSGSTNPLFTSTHDTSAQTDVVLTCQLANVGDSQKLESIRVILYRP